MATNSQQHQRESLKLLDNDNNSDQDASQEHSILAFVWKTFQSLYSEKLSLGAFLSWIMFLGVFIFLVKQSSYWENSTPPETLALITINPHNPFETKDSINVDNSSENSSSNDLDVKQFFYFNGSEALINLNADSSVISYLSHLPHSSKALIQSDSSSEDVDVVALKILRRMHNSSNTHSYSKHIQEWQDRIKSQPITRKLKFIHITKTGGTFIERIGLQVGLEWGQEHKEYGWWHGTFRTIKKSLKDKYDWFVVVRNPYTRIISEVHCKFGGLGDHQHKLEAMTTETFNQYVLDNLGRVTSFGNHYTKQWKYIDTDTTTHIVRYENFEEEFVALMLRYNLTNVLQFMNRTHDNAAATKYFSVGDFNETTLRHIRNFYKMDFDYFGYDMYDLSRRSL